MKTSLSIFKFMCLLILVVNSSCSSKGARNNPDESGNLIVQQEDGTVALKIDKAATYSDVVNPTNNTADWNIVISKPGRFKIWLASATKDTLSLKYANPVKVNILDDHLEINPVIDKIVHNSDDVPSAYFRADSYVGSFYVPQPGEYNVQLISDKVIANDIQRADDTMLMSLILTPAIR